MFIAEVEFESEGTSKYESDTFENIDEKANVEGSQTIPRLTIKLRVIICIILFSLLTFYRNLKKLFYKVF